MIVNVPTSQDLDDVALRLHFSAWSSVIRIRSDFDQVYIPGEDPSDGQWQKEWSEYIEGYQPEMQAVGSVIQQSNELALKAKICAVSPFLLLVNSNPKFSTTARDIDFSEFRTLDAVDLPASVNSLCPNSLSDDYIQAYNEIRSLRNKFAHLGRTGQHFQPGELTDLLVRQYIELWSDRRWLKDRVSYASRTGPAFFHDGRHFTAASEVMDEWPHTFAHIKKGAFKKLFGFNKTARRYLCHHCVREATTKWYEVDLDKSKTAFLKDSPTLHCLMCDEGYAVERRRCTADGCRGNVIGPSEHHGCDVCHTCGDEV